MKNFKNLSQEGLCQQELKSITGGSSVLSAISVVPVPIVLPMKIGKWIAGVFK